ncbi:MAG: hypothetical protein BWY31_04771 [Lentisphaerae bacterium ADurb.Bin242]|nr:MAG: hypothetical protein BWY31_04771 [Lentisphaerae bacterium ADurb.Bin242]
MNGIEAQAPHPKHVKFRRPLRGGSEIDESKTEPAARNQVRRIQIRKCFFRLLFRNDGRGKNFDFIRHQMRIGTGRSQFDFKIPNLPDVSGFKDHPCRGGLSARFRRMFRGACKEERFFIAAASEKPDFRRVENSRRAAAHDMAFHRPDGKLRSQVETNPDSSLSEPADHRSVHPVFAGPAVRQTRPFVRIRISPGSVRRRRKLRGNPVRPFQNQIFSVRHPGKKQRRHTKNQPFHRIPPFFNTHNDMCNRRRRQFSDGQDAHAIRETARSNNGREHFSARRPEPGSACRKSFPALRSSYIRGCISARRHNGRNNNTGGTPAAFRRKRFYCSGSGRSRSDSRVLPTSDWLRKCCCGRDGASLRNRSSYMGPASEPENC